MSPDDPRHGTTAGYAAHARAGVPICEPCQVARAEYVRKRDDARKRPCAGCGKVMVEKLLCRSCAQFRAARLREERRQRGVYDSPPEREWTEQELDPVTEWVKVKSPSGHLILRRAS